jgi:hypothetical protein
MPAQPVLRNKILKDMMNDLLSDLNFLLSIVWLQLRLYRINHFLNQVLSSRFILKGLATIGSILAVILRSS